MYNGYAIRAPPFTAPLKVELETGQYSTIASGTYVKQSWEGLFQVPKADGIGPSHNLDISIVDMTKGSYFVKTYLGGVFDSRGEGRCKRKPRIANQKAVLLSIAKHRAAWDHRISASGMSNRFDHDEDDGDAIAAGAIYSIFRMIPRDKDTAVSVCRLRWHEYYDDFPDNMLWAVLHEFLKFLNRLTTKRGSLNTTIGLERTALKLKNFQNSLGKTLLDICQNSAASDGDVSPVQPVQREDPTHESDTLIEHPNDDNININGDLFDEHIHAQVYKRRSQHEMLEVNQMDESDRPTHDLNNYNDDDKHKSEVFGGDEQTNAQAHTNIELRCQDIDLWVPPPWVTDHPLYRRYHEEGMRAAAATIKIPVPNLSLDGNGGRTLSPAPQERRTPDHPSVTGPRLVPLVPGKSATSNPTPCHSSVRPQTQTRPPKRSSKDADINQQEQVLWSSRKKPRKKPVLLPKKRIRAASFSSTSTLAMEEASPVPRPAPAVRQKQTHPEVRMFSPPTEYEQNYDISLFNYTAGVRSANARSGQTYADPNAILDWVQPSSTATLSHQPANSSHSVGGVALNAECEEEQRCNDPEVEESNFVSQYLLSWWTTD